MKEANERLADLPNIAREQEREVDRLRTEGLGTMSESTGKESDGEINSVASGSYSAHVKAEKTEWKIKVSGFELRTCRSELIYI